MLINDTTKSARKICKAIKNNKYHDLDWHMIYTNDVDTTAFVNDPEINLKKNISPLHYAALKGRFDIVAYLIKRGAKPAKVVNGQSLTARLWCLDKPKLLHLLELFFNDQLVIITEDITAEIRTKITASVNGGYDDGRTLLMRAIIHGRQNLVNALIKAGASINQLNYENKTALDIAIRQNKQSIARLLLGKEGIKVPKDNNILHEAIKNNLPLDIIKKLINQGANIEYQDENGTPLIIAAKEGRADIIKLLIKYKVRTDALDNKNMNWEKAYKQKLMIPVYCASIVTLAALPYAIIGAVVTDNLFTSLEKFNPNGWNISIIAASFVGVIGLPLILSYLENARGACDIFITEIKGLINKQSSTQQNKIPPTPSAPPLKPNQLTTENQEKVELTKNKKTLPLVDSYENDSDNENEPGLSDGWS